MGCSLSNPSAFPAPSDCTPRLGHGFVELAQNIGSAHENHSIVLRLFSCFASRASRRNCQLLLAQAHEVGLEKSREGILSLRGEHPE
jgi:hypothetical protein